MPPNTPDPAAHYNVIKNISNGIFRAYDIRGIVDKNLTADAVYTLGLAIGSEAAARGQRQLVVARDGRLSGPALSAALIAGLLATGLQLIDIGIVPTPVLYFATHWLKTQAGVMLTGSHNPTNYNGLKTILGGSVLAENDIQQLYHRIQAGNFVFGAGSIEKQDISEAYIERISSDVKSARP